MVSPDTTIEPMLPPDVGRDMALVLGRMLEDLQELLVHVDGQPDPAVLLISVNEAPVGLGSFLGEETRGPLGRVELKGGRLECVVRFTLWGANAAAANEAVLGLQGGLLGASRRLAGRGFLRFNALTSSQPAFDSALNSWGRTADYGLLYEYRYEATDAAESLIARIPVHADQERPDSPERETMLITDEMARWDELVAPILRARGPVRVARLTALVFAPVLPGGEVVLRRTFDGAAGAPVEHGSLAEFLAALADEGAPQRHALVKLGPFADFLSLLSTAGAPLQMGNWDEDGALDEYRGFELTLDPPVRLEQVFDRLELIYGSGSEPLDKVAVIYLRFKQ